ncbi:hypothetical protein [Luedemannella helvata]|uniref:Integral membrane protein n=1 Tax=Luedemannella helvata TaxID=349315 RepID=A0ABP4WKU8_9ACTN
MAIRQKLRMGLKGNRRVALAWAVLFVAAYPALFVSAALTSVIAFAASLTAVVLAEWQAPGRAPGLATALKRAQLDAPHRLLLRDAAILAFVARSVPTATAVALAATLLALHLLRGVVANRLRNVELLRTLPMLTRNLDLGALRIPDAPAAWLGRARRVWLGYAGLPLAVGVVVDTVAGTRVSAPVLAALTLLAVAAVAVAAAREVPRNRHLGNTKWATAEILRQVAAYRPEAVVYFTLTGEGTSTYQIDQWLPTMARLPRRTLILVREREHVPRIAPTHLPILCVPTPADVQGLALPDARVVFYVANAAKNIHMLRRVGVRHVFINHGESDKAANANRFTRVYDAVWVAGPAGRGRYGLTNGAVTDDMIVEVGRPQTAGIEPAVPHERPFTVLYAPTWEGVSASQAFSSVLPAGEAIVTALLSLNPAVRIIYKPHPLTGSRVPAAGQASRRIAALIARANELRAVDPAFAAVIAAEAPARAAAAEQVRALTARVAELTAVAAGGDAAQLARDNGCPDPADFAELAACERQLREADWVASGRWAHRVVTGRTPDLVACFNEADLLVCDLSAVATDFLASDKPYLMVNVSRGDDEAFRAANATAGGAYLIGPDAVGLADVVAAVRAAGPGADPFAERRRATREHLLGPARPDSFSRFVAALDAIEATLPVRAVPAQSPSWEAATAGA